MTLLLDHANVADISIAIKEVSVNVITAFSQSTPPEKVDAAEPGDIADALEQFIEIMQLVEIDQANEMVFSDTVQSAWFGSADADAEPLGTEDITEIGNHGLALIENLSDWADTLKLKAEKHQLRAIMVVVALWVARHGGSLLIIESVVDTLAALTNTASEMEILVELTHIMDELINAVSSDVKQDGYDRSMGGPWRALNINCGIAATRTHDTDIMESVFEQMVQNLPDEASLFFAEGIEQMQSLNYPQQVREMMIRYFQTYTKRVLH